MSGIVLACFPGVFKSAFYFDLSGSTYSATATRTLGEDNSELIESVVEQVESVDWVVVNYDKDLVIELSKRVKVVMVVPSKVPKEDWFKRFYFEGLEALGGNNYSEYESRYEKLVWEANCLEIEGVQKVLIKNKNQFVTSRRIRKAVEVSLQ